MTQDEREDLRIGDLVYFHGRAHLVERIESWPDGREYATLRYADRRPRETRRSPMRVSTYHPALSCLPVEVAR